MFLGHSVYVCLSIFTIHYDLNVSKLAFDAQLKLSCLLYLLYSLIHLVALAYLASNTIGLGLENAGLEPYTCPSVCVCVCKDRQKCNEVK